MNETAKLKSCPFCRGDNIKMMHKDIGLIGWNGLGAKKIKYQSYAMCNKCYSKGSPATCEYEVDTERGRAILEENDQKAAAAWNRRAEQNPQPLTIEELQEFIDSDEEDNAIWIKNMEYDYFTRALLDWDRDRGIFAIWHGDKNTSDFPIEKDYGKTWLAYRTKPEGSEK